MDNPNPSDSSKRFRWVGRLSEEELLGLPAAPRTRRAGVGRPRRTQPFPPAPDTALPEKPPERRLHTRDIVAVAAVAVAAWFGFQEAGNRSPFRQASPVGPANAAEVTVASVDLDRHELASLPRRSETAPTASETTSSGGGGPAGGQGSGSEKDPTPRPPGETQKPPLVEATIPGVGSVTIEDPELPLPDGTPTLPEADGVIPPVLGVPPAPTLP